MNNQKIILPVKEISATLQHSCERLFHPHKLPLPSDKDCYKLVRALVEDALTSLMNWCPASEAGEDMLEDIFPWYLSGKSGQKVRVIDEHSGRLRDVVAVPGDRFSEMFFHEIYDPVSVRVAELLSKLINGNTWDIWTVIPCGGDILIENSGDYRIYEFEVQSTE